MPASDARGPAPDYDPVFLNSRREALLVLAVWLVCLIWTVGYCAVAGYGEPSAAGALVLGMPRWVWWGVFVPWVAATVFSVWFGLGYIADDDLGDDAADLPTSSS